MRTLKNLSRLLIISAFWLIGADAFSQTHSLLEAGIASFEKGDYQEAKSNLLTALENKILITAHLYYYLGQVCFKEQNYSEALEWFEKAVEAAPKNSDYHLWLGRLYARIALRSSILKKPFLAFKIKRSFEMAVAFDPDNTEARLALLYYYLQAPALFGGGRAKARIQAREIEKRAPPFAHLAKGLIAADAKNNVAAEKALKRAIRVQETAVFAYQRLEKIYRDQGNPESVIMMYLEVLKEYPEDVIALTRTGYLYQETQRYEEAFAIWEHIVAIAPGELNARLQIGRTASFSGLHLDSGEKNILFYLEETEGAASEKRALAHNVLAKIYRLKGENELARQAYLAALKFDPSSKEARRAIKALK